MADKDEPKYAKWKPRSHADPKQGTRIPDPATGLEVIVACQLIDRSDSGIPLHRAAQFSSANVVDTYVHVPQEKQQAFAQAWASEHNRDRAGEAHLPPLAFEEVMRAGGNIHIARDWPAEHLRLPGRSPHAQMAAAFDSLAGAGYRLSQETREQAIKIADDYAAKVNRPAGKRR